MKITKVSFQKAFIIGPYLQHRIGFEAEIDEYKEDATLCLTALQKMADWWDGEHNHMQLPPNIGAQTAEIDYKKVESWEAEIDNCTDSEQLEKWISDHPAIPGKLLSIINKRRNALKTNQ